MSFRYGVLLTGYASASKNPDGTSFGLLWQPQTEADRAKLIKGVTMRNKPDPPPPPHCLLDEDVVENLPARPAPLDPASPPHAQNISQGS